MVIWLFVIFGLAILFNLDYDSKHTPEQKLKNYKKVCPRCGSKNCHAYVDKVVIPGKIETRYSVNLNPFRPFTLINQKDKVIRKERVLEKTKFICDDCGNNF